MQFIKFISNLFKNIIFKIVMSVFAIIFLFCIFFFKDWFILQYHHIIAYYLVYKGDKAYAEEQLTNAINYYNRALQLYPEHTKARYNLANIHVAFEDFENAADLYRQTIKYDPNFTKARIHLGIILTEELYNPDEAIENYKATVKSKPFILNIPKIYTNGDDVKNDKAVAYYNMGLAYKTKSLIYGDDTEKSRQNLEYAADSYKQALKIRKDDYDTLYNLALTYQLLGRKEDAAVYYCKAINLKPLNFEAHYNFAILLKSMKQYFYSKQELEKAGLVLDSKGDTYISRYIYDIFREVNYKLMIQQKRNPLVDKMMKEEIPLEGELTYVGGKVVVSDKLDETIINNLKTCNICKDYKEKKE